MTLIPCLCKLATPPDGHDVGVSQSSEVRKSCIGHNRVYHGLGHWLALCYWLRPFQDLRREKEGARLLPTKEQPKDIKDAQGAHVAIVPELGPAELLPVEAAALAGVQHHRSIRCPPHHHTAQGSCLPGQAGV